MRKTLLILLCLLPFTSFASTIPVHSGDNLQAALNKAQYGDEIVLDAGASFTGSFELKEKNGSGTITVRSSAEDKLPEGKRVSPSDSEWMPKIKSPGKNLPTLTATPGVAGYKIIGIEFTKASPETFTTNLISLEGKDITLDRVYAHGDPTSNLRRCIALNGANLSVTNSYIADCHEHGADSQAIAGWNGPGPFLIENNYLEGASENVLFGGADPSIPNLIPSDITIRGNYFFKPLSWKGKGWDVKNLLETKNAQRVLVENNVFENSWVEGQTGTAILIKSANQGGNCPWCQSKDITFKNNVIKNVVEGLRINGAEGQGQLPPKVTNVKFSGDRFENISGKLFQIFNGASNITFENVYGDAEDAILFGDAGNNSTNSGLVIRNSTFTRGKYGVGAGSEEGSEYLNKWFPSAVFENNTLVNKSGISNDKIKSKYPANTKIDNQVETPSKLPNLPTETPTPSPTPSLPSFSNQSPTWLQSYIDELTTWVKSKIP
ncbi:hypothetical protein KW807_01695 [Candidatus Parcubacteria bacterium]|nr:hypothetical protein [Candidatus Parcubacteria bacterium]